MAQYAKAIGAAVATIVMFVIFGDDGGQPGTKTEDLNEVGLAIATLVTTFVVFLVPNRKGGE